MKKFLLNFFRRFWECLFPEWELAMAVAAAGSSSLPLQEGGKEQSASKERTFQILGCNEQVSGFYERLFHKGAHPTRRNVGAREMQKHFDAAESFVLYEIYKDEGETLSKAELSAKIAEQFPSADINVQMALMFCQVSRLTIEWTVCEGGVA